MYYVYAMDMETARNRERINSDKVFQSDKTIEPLIACLL